MPHMSLRDAALFEYPGVVPITFGGGGHYPDEPFPAFAMASDFRDFVVPLR